MTIVLDLESNRSTYDLLGGSSVKSESHKSETQSNQTPRAQVGADWSDDDFAQENTDLPGEKVPVLRRGAHQGAGGTGSRKQNSGTRGGGISLTNKPMLIVAGLIVCVLLGLLVHFVAGYVGSNPPKPTETVLITSSTAAITIA